MAFLQIGNGVRVDFDSSVNLGSLAGNATLHNDDRSFEEGGSLAMWLKMEDCSGGNYTGGGIVAGSEYRSYWRQSTGFQIACVGNGTYMSGGYQSAIR